MSLLLFAAVSSSVAAAPNDMKFSIVQQGPQSGLQQLALWFHQDWKLLFGNANEAISVYVGGITESRRGQLRAELVEFLREHEGAGDQALLGSWYALGAQGWQAGLDIRRTLTDVAKGRR